MRTSADPWTPDKHAKCSKRSFDGQIRKWRRQLHAYDPIPGMHTTSEHDPHECDDWDSRVHGVDKRMK